MKKVPGVKPLHWVGSSKKDLMSMPKNVIDEFGFALFLAQTGQKHPQAKPLAGFGAADILEVVESDADGTFRAIYTVRFPSAVYVLHCFQKKSHKGIATPKQDSDLIRQRLRQIELQHKGIKR